MTELDERILDVAWLAFAASQRQHECDATALADALTAIAPLVTAAAYRKAGARICCGACDELLRGLADDLDGAS